ncbi:myosin light chain kinase 2, skeletal/cardiac muscle isoform X1 [Nothobranchius furzeri]|uniref:Myosin light chain kinase family member 4 n=2 Tax=Nothobranchius furzeri TaxID=105023 RepID=A0A8C6PV23_NOTFU|nr:transcript variant X1 [Nothobranchius furzeri]
MSSLVINASGDCKNAGFDLIQDRIETLSSKMDKLIHIQEKVLSRLDGMSQEIDDIEQDMEHLMVDKEEIHLPPKMMNQTQVVGREVREICHEMSTIMSVVNRRSEQQAQKLEGMEKLVLSMQQVISFIGETVKSSKVIERMFKGPAARKAKSKDNKGKQTIKKLEKKSTSSKASKGKQEIIPACEPSPLQPSHKTKLQGPKHFFASHKCGNSLKDHKGKDVTDKCGVSQKNMKTQKKTKPPDAADISLKKQVLLLEELQKLNRENTEKSGPQLIPVVLEAGVPPKAPQPEEPVSNLPDFLSEDTKITEAEKPGEEQFGDEEAAEKAKEAEPDVEGAVLTKEVPEETQTEIVFAAEEAEDEDKKEVITTSEEQKNAIACVETQQEATEEEEQKKDINEEDEQRPHCADWAVFKADGIEIQMNLREKVEIERQEYSDDLKKEEDEVDDDAERFFIDTTPPPAAPFNHRIVSAKPNQIRNFYTINWQEVLGGGRFGQVHKCVENSSGLTLAAKIIKARNQKEKDMVKNEIQVMNNLDHANLIQLYAAYESRNDIILVLEYVGGGELFDRIIDENYKLMELDAVVFIKQICEGLQYMHKMSVLHLDLKPENILCVNRITNRIKIIDFGLARIYKPREKLKVNFGTPEFLAPEIVNYDFVSFNTDMWSLGVITYMLLSGLCPFLGDDDNETLNNILACQWNFEEQEFIDTSEEAKDFIRRLLVVNRSWRMGACEAMRHPWLSDPVLHHRLHTKKTMCRSRRSSCVPPSDS